MGGEEGHDGGALTNGIGALIKGTPESSLASSAMRGPVRSWQSCLLYTSDAADE